jgi:hypothetical protein
MDSRSDCGCIGGLDLDRHCIRTRTLGEARSISRASPGNWRHGVNVAAIGNRLYVIGGHIASDSAAGEAADTDTNEVYEFPN